MKSLRLGPGVEAFVIPLIAIAASMIPFGIFLCCVGANPFTTFGLMYRGGFGTAFSLQQSLVLASPLLLAALCTALPARMGLVIIGGEGAVVLGGLAAAIVPHFFPGLGSDLLMLVAMAAAGMIVGGLWIAFAGALKQFRGVNETISSLLLYYIAIAIFNQLVEGPWRDPASLNKPSTWQFDVRLQTVGKLIERWWPGTKHTIKHMPDDTFAHETIKYLYGVFSGVHMGFFIGLIACVLCWILIQHTTFGFSVRIIGGNPRAGRVAGLPVAKTLLTICFLGGAMAGLAGMIQVSCSEGCANASALNAGYGFAGILVAFMARQSPMGVIPVALLLGGIAASNGQLQEHQNLPDATVKVLQGILFVMILASESYYGRFKIFQRRPAPAAIPPASPILSDPINKPEVAHA